MRPPAHVEVTLLWGFFWSWRRGIQQKRSQDVGTWDEAGGTPPSPAAGDTKHTTRDEAKEYRDMEAASSGSKPQMGVLLSVHN